jgi:putative phage-type endonuclease
VNSLDLIQGSDEWRKARAGSLGASQIADALARTKSGYGASRANLAAQLVVERLTKTPTEGFTNAAMLWGVEKEPEARLAYEFFNDVSVVSVGLVPHPTIKGTHASPDGLIGGDGLIEIKCPQSATHLETLRTEAIPLKYQIQMLWQIQCTGRQWCDFASFDPRLPENMRLFVKRLFRDDKRIAELETEVKDFLREVEDSVSDLIEKYGEPA